MSRCRSCNAEIIWATVNGKQIPLNKRRVRTYIENVNHTDIRTHHEGSLAYISHFNTCPNASQHSKKGKGKGKGK